MNLNDIPTAQTEGQVMMYHEIIEKYNVKTFIELGAYMGGLTYDIITKHPELKVISFQIDPHELNSKVVGMPQIIIGDVFEQSSIETTRSAVQSTDGISMVFCDNGNKIKEFDTYYPLLKSGDIILVHDYPGECPVEFVERVQTYKDMEMLEGYVPVICGFAVWRKL